MPQCPKCGAALKDDYGMINCPGCGSFVFVDMDGVARMDEAEAAPQPTSVGFPLPDPSLEPQDEQNQFENFSFGGMSEETPAQEEPLPLEEPQAFDFNAETPAESTQPDIPSPIAEASEDFSMDALLGYQPEPGSVPVGPDLGPPDDPLGLSEYANSEASLAKDGPLMFRLLISGLDSKELRQSLREALEDARFAWDTNELMARVPERGELVIENVSPVKAVILVNRIKRLPIQIRWEQYAISQVENP